MTKAKKDTQSQKQIDELTLDLQRTRADFENYLKRVENEKQAARDAGASSMIMKLIPTVDNIERAIAHIPEELKDNPWAQSVQKLTTQLEKSLESLDVKKIPAEPGQAFDPELHEAIQFDEDAEGEHEVIAEVLQAGYSLKGHPLRHAMVKVTRK